MTTFAQRFVCSALLALGAAGLAASLQVSAAWSAAKEPPTCAAISFRPLPSGASDGDQDAGLYKSRFGKIIVTGTVKGGEVQSYYVTVNDARPGDAGTLPASVASCATSKHLPAPGKPEASCVGDKLQVLIEHSGAKRYVLLYARQSGKWGLCSAGAT
jgi:hypothetical protein